MRQPPQYRHCGSARQQRGETRAPAAAAAPAANPPRAWCSSPLRACSEACESGVCSSSFSIFIHLLLIGGGGGGSGKQPRPAAWGRRLPAKGGLYIPRRPATKSCGAAGRGRRAAANCDAHAATAAAAATSSGAARHHEQQRPWGRRNREARCVHHVRRFFAGAAAPGSIGGATKKHEVGPRSWRCRSERGEPCRRWRWRWRGLDNRQVLLLTGGNDEALANSWWSVG